MSNSKFFLIIYFLNYIKIFLIIYIYIYIYIYSCEAEAYPIKCHNFKGYASSDSKILVPEVEKCGRCACKKHFNAKVNLMCQRINTNEYVINILHKMCLLYYCSWAFSSWALVKSLII